MSLVVQPSKHATQCFDAVNPVKMWERLRNVADNTGPTNRRKRWY